MLFSIWGQFRPIQPLTEPVVEHQFDVVHDAAEETAFFHFVHHHQRTLVDGFAVQLEVDAADHGFRQRRVNFRVFST